MDLNLRPLPLCSLVLLLSEDLPWSIRAQSPQYCSSAKSLTAAYFIIVVDMRRQSSEHVAVAASSR